MYSTRVNANRGGSGFVTDEKGHGWNASQPERMVPLSLFEPKLPPALKIAEQTGVAVPGTFTSEFGAVTMASFGEFRLIPSTS
jgi:hypothetical protein